MELLLLAVVELFVLVFDNVDHVRGAFGDLFPDIETVPVARQKPLRFTGYNPATAGS